MVSPSMISDYKFMVTQRDYPIKELIFDLKSLELEMSVIDSNRCLIRWQDEETENKLQKSIVRLYYELITSLLSSS